MIINGTEDTVIDLNSAVTCTNADLTFNGVKFVSDNADYKGIQHVASVAYNDCKFEGKFHLYGDSYFTNCEFTNKNDYSIWTYGAPKAEFVGCTFNTGGKAILVYNEKSTESFKAEINVKNCVFNDDDTLTTVKAAVETGSLNVNTETSNKYTLVFENVTVNGFAENDEGIATGSKLWGNKNSMDTDHLSVTIDGTKVY